MIPSLEVRPTKAKEAPSPHEVRLTLLEISEVFQCLGLPPYHRNQKVNFESKEIGYFFR